MNIVVTSKGGKIIALGENTTRQKVKAINWNREK